MRISRTKLLCLSVVTFLCLRAVASAEWRKDPMPPDVDKIKPDLTCWLATAANMLAAAGYGSGADAQEKAEGIYMQLKKQFGQYE